MSEPEPETSEYLDFRLTGDTGKTRIYTVYARRTGRRLAIIKWFGRWRQYAMFPEPETVWNVDCLTDIRDFIDGLMGDRRRAARGLTP